MRVSRDREVQVHYTRRRRLVVLSHLNLIRNRKHVDEIDIGEAVFSVGTARRMLKYFRTSKGRY